MYREVTMLGVREVLRLWREGVPTRRLAGQLGLDPKTVRRYLRAAAAAGLRTEDGAVSEDQLLQAEHAVDLETGAIVAVTLPGAVVITGCDSGRFVARSFFTKRCTLA